MAKAQGKIASRYARALFSAVEVSTLEARQQALESLAQAWESSEQLRNALSNPSVPLTARVSVLKDIVESISPNDQAICNFTALLAENNRLEVLADVSRVFGNMIAELRKLLALEVSSAFEISEQERNQLIERVKADFGSMASISWKVDKALLGGLQIRSGDRLLDNSVSGALERLRQSLFS